MNASGGEKQNQHVHDDVMLSVVAIMTVSGLMNNILSGLNT